MKSEKFKSTYMEYHHMVIHLAYDILQDYDLAHHVCQEVFIELSEKIKSMDQERIKGWLLRCAKRKSIESAGKGCRKNKVSVSAEE